MISQTEPGRTETRRAQAQAGFTLIELMVVIVILGLMLALIGMNARPISPALHARSAAEEISGAMRAARSTALMRNRSVAFELDLAAPSYRWGGQAAEALPGDLRYALLTGRDQQVSDSRGTIRFDPDGGSSGGRVTITGGGQFWFVGVDWLSGRVSVVHATR